MSTNMTVVELWRTSNEIILDLGLIIVIVIVIVWR